MAKKIVAQEACMFCAKKPCECSTKFKCSMCEHTHERKDLLFDGVVEGSTLDNGKPEMLCVWCSLDKYNEDPMGTKT